MSKWKFDDNCKGCRPAMLDVQTHRVLPDDSPQMKCVLAVWAETTLDERKAFHRFTCLNSRKNRDVRIVQELQLRMQKALESIPPVFL